MFKYYTVNRSYQIRKIHPQTVVTACYLLHILQYYLLPIFSYFG